MELIIPVLVAAVAPLATYLIAARRFSGKIESSEATELWAESRSIRDTLRQENLELRRDLAEARERIAALETKIAQLEAP